ncbi:MAG: hypothetical protein K2N38_03400 [Oscillospiraceae bacterium]|nr:hypothetical protein [Oscillospiraceae bacterium]
MDEIIEQYIDAKKMKKSMLIAMIAILAMAAGLIVCGFIIRDLITLFLISGVVVAVLGAAVFIIYAAAFNKLDKMVRQYLAANGKSEEEINSILGGSAN